MNSRHKYFRNLHHKEKIENKALGHKTYWSHVMFFTKEPDPRYERECTHRFISAAKGRPIDTPMGRNYVYFKRPEVPYTILKVHTDHDYSKRRKWLCKQANKAVRRAWKQKGEVYQHGSYKKVFDVVWELD